MTQRRASPWKRFFLAASLLLITVAAKQRAVVPPWQLDSPPRDIFSAAEPAAVRTTHLILDLTVDFESRTIHGSATHWIANSSGTRKLLLDTSNLDIDAVTVDGAAATWSFGEATPTTRPLSIDIGPNSRVVKIAYSTRPAASALHWLTAKQTAGDLAPFLYSLGEPSTTRSWIPLQDTPAVRLTWEATLRVPTGLLALMAAPNPTAPNETGVYEFRMDQPVPAYLIALAVGRIAFRSFDDRSGVYAEPELIDDAAWDMQSVPELLDAAEDVLGPYPFERYDILFVPGFVVSGMENPRLNFLTYGLILGNHEWPPPPNATVAHELAHSWGGDLVTCATWNDTWLNEGFATYYEKRLYEAMGLGERAELGYFFDRQAFEGSLDDLSPSRSVLHRQFESDERPDSAFNVTSYQKGSLFLKMIDDVAGRDEFDHFVSEYLRSNAFHWVDDREFLEVLGETALRRDGDLASRLRLDDWIYGMGLPSNVTAPKRSQITDRVAVQAAAFRAGASASSLTRTGWSSIEVTIFLSMIADVISNRMADLDAAFGFSSMNTPPVAWLVATARTFYAPAVPGMERFLRTGVSNVLPIYSQLVTTSKGRDYALAFYVQVRDDYPPNIQEYLDSLLRFRPGQAAEMTGPSDGRIRGATAAGDA